MIVKSHRCSIPAIYFSITDIHVPITDVDVLLLDVVLFLLMAAIRVWQSPSLVPRAFLLSPSKGLGTRLAISMMLSPMSMFPSSDNRYRVLRTVHEQGAGV